MEILLDISVVLWIYTFFLNPTNSQLYYIIVMKTFSIQTIIIFFWLGTHNVTEFKGTCPWEFKGKCPWNVFCSINSCFFNFGVHIDTAFIQVSHVKNVIQFNNITFHVSDDYHENGILHHIFMP